MLQMTWIPTRRSKSVSSMDWMMDSPMLWKPETLRTFRPWYTRLLCSRIGEEYCQACASRSARVNRAPTQGPASTPILRLTNLSSAPSLRVSADALTYWTRICYPLAADDSMPQSFSDSKHWEIECSRNPNHSECNTE
jgi:hypothetical protein